MNQTIDRRKLKTRKALHQSLVALVLEKGYDAVTISEIAENADLGRATFYLHYKDKDELLIEMMNALVNDFMAQLSKYPIRLLDIEHTELIHQAFLFAKQHSDLFRVIMRGHGPFTTTLRLQEQIAEYIQQRSRENFGIDGLNPRIPADVISNYFAGALLSCIFWWLEKDSGYTAEQMAEYYKKLVVMDRQQLLGL